MLIMEQIGRDVGETPLNSGLTVTVSVTNALSIPAFCIFKFLLMEKTLQSLQITHEAEMHLSQSKKEDDDDEDDDEGSSKNGKAQILVKLKC